MVVEARCCGPDQRAPFRDVPAAMRTRSAAMSHIARANREPKSPARGLAPFLSLSFSLARSRYQSGRTRAGSTTDYAYRYTTSTSISRQRSFRGSRRTRWTARVPFFRSRQREKQPRDVASRGPASRRTVPRVAQVAVIPCHGLKSEPRARET